MKTKNFLFSGILGIALTGAILTGCKKDTPGGSSTSSDYAATQDDANAQAATNDSKNISDAGVQGNSSQYGPSHSIQALYSSNCTVTHSVNDTSAADTLYINFGPTPVQCRDYRWRQGEIIVYWNRTTGHTLFQSYFDSSSVITMTFRNYAFGNAQSNMIGVTGTRTLTNTGRNTYGQVNWDFTASLTLSYPDGKTATWSSTRQNTLVETGGVYYYKITGAAYGTSKSGAAYTLSIQSPLYFTALPWWLGGCNHIEAGSITINITPTGNSVTNTWTISYGTIANLGTCPTSATVSIDGNSYQISLI